MSSSEVAEGAATGALRYSTLRHRPIQTTTAAVYVTTPRASLGRGAQAAPITENTLHPIQNYAALHAQRIKRQQHWTVTVGISMLGMCLLLWLAQSLWHWGTITYDDLTYGRPRTMQTDAYVGHESSSHSTPSHFIALNQHGRIEIIELPGGDASHAHIILGPQIWGPDADLVPITLSFVPSATGQGRQQDMIISFQGSRIRLRNEKGTFVLPSTSN
ncbi:hypothetical protein [Dictyobacter arantiisoli]|uniref:Uncharacterized protein n=1 Tax=Dictyobacter arantiisoli TaxID=2014874 RepID=A0A5A5TDJ5_9CHLR|nr:hypothetical protein [Dictyobacter arantiisoli]GCF08934.1 hypothetical protein KDI_24980 [Dictyobacter arantiisoli]